MYYCAKYSQIIKEKLDKSVCDKGKKVHLLNGLGRNHGISVLYVRIGGILSVHVRQIARKLRNIKFTSPVQSVY